MTPLKAIREKCLDCRCHKKDDVKLCMETNCALYTFRMGKNPYRMKHEYTKKWRAAMAERLAAARKNKED